MDMNYYQVLLNQISVPESAVDCSKCSIEWKCCTYRPFIANFLVGGFASPELLDEKLIQDWDFLIVGLAPNLKYRKLFLKKGKWGFGTEASLLCSFYHKASGGCQIWQSRPAVCRTFFCKSSYPESGASYWKKAEEFTWRLEWVLLEDFLHTKGWSLEEVHLIKKYLDEANVSQSIVLPEGAQFRDVDSARNFYQEAASYVAGLSQEEVLDLLAPEGVVLYQELLAQAQKLR
jgi:Fe-S-cluster containining protein